MLYKWKKSVPSLFSLSLDYVVEHLNIYTLNGCDNLKYLPIHIKDQLLKRITISSCFWKWLDFKNTFSMMVHACVKHIDLTSVYVDDELLQVLEICKGLQKVYLSRVGTQNFTRSGLLNLLKCLPKLQFLQLRNCNVVDDVVLECLSENCLNLSALDLGGCTKITDKGMNYLNKLNKIQCLTISKTQVTNEGLISFVKRPCCAILKELKLDNCIHITEIGLLAVTKHCPNLEILVYYNCSVPAAETSLMENNLKSLRQLTWSISW
ncbi:hypothetical protein WA026_014014 [Henosepilachna vigintioctopunctata]|uniref:F-box/LRR-repeat protein 15-like leucin rich repeat domain-containing protein n=1 Tax=Henosepilachna vigintioctopunctata TaxID=420089 RepID=A0AAW1U9D3_9CUCU